MIRDLRELKQRENTLLAPYAVRNDPTYTARRYPEIPHPLRTDFQRDRDRVLHSHAFRRLEYKTQVFLSGSGDHLRTRLTHTIEVAAIARTLARALGLNEDLTEAIALAHDLGHTPFGHAGERALHALMLEHGGFDHNLQALRVVDILEIKYPSYDGINLTFALRSGLVKHRGPGVRLDGAELSPGLFPEAQIADLADDLTYYGHDVDDGLSSGLLTPAMLDTLPLWRLATEAAREAGLRRDDERFTAFSVRCLIDRMVGDAIRQTSRNFETAAPDSPEAVMNRPEALVAFSPEYTVLTRELRDFLYENLYFSKELSKLNGLSMTQMELLFRHFTTRPEDMGETARGRIATDGIHRAAADYLAGMTDPFAVSEYLRLK